MLIGNFGSLFIQIRAYPILFVQFFHFLEELNVPLFEFEYTLLRNILELPFFKTPFFKVSSNIKVIRVLFFWKISEWKAFPWEVTHTILMLTWIKRHLPKSPRLNEDDDDYNLAFAEENSKRLSKTLWQQINFDFLRLSRHVLTVLTITSYIWLEMTQG